MCFCPSRCREVAGTFGRLSGNDDDVAMDGNDYDNLDNYDDGDDDTSLRGFRVNVKSTADAVGASAMHQ